MKPGAEAALRIDQTLTQDATGTMAYLEFESMGIDRVRTERDVRLTIIGKPRPGHSMDLIESLGLRPHIDFVSAHPGVPRMIFGELQQPAQTLPKQLVQALVHDYGARLRRLLEAGKTQGELAADLDLDAAAVLFIGTIQGLVMQSLLAGDVARIRRDAPGVFAIYRRGIANSR